MHYYLRMMKVARDLSGAYSQQELIAKSQRGLRLSILALVEDLSRIEGQEITDRVRRTRSGDRFIVPAYGASSHEKDQKLLIDPVETTRDRGITLLPRPHADPKYLASLAGIDAVVQPTRSPMPTMSAISADSDSDTLFFPI